MLTIQPSKGMRVAWCAMFGLPLPLLLLWIFFDAPPNPYNSLVMGIFSLFVSALIFYFTYREVSLRIMMDETNIYLKRPIRSYTVPISEIRSAVFTYWGRSTHCLEIKTTDDKRYPIFNHIFRDKQLHEIQSLLVARSPAIKLEKEIDNDSEATVGLMYVAFLFIAVIATFVWIAMGAPQ